IAVCTPFDSDKFELLLTTHPNRRFTDSVVRGLREGFWPFHSGELDDHLKTRHTNYPMDEKDLAAVRAHRDTEVAAGHWSGPLETGLLPGMIVSPLFVVWQKGKPRVITDNTASGLNDGISLEDAKVRYDDMHSFGQSMR
ncbi:hypothetical protein BDV98DRAFT_479250, partial [Pterulicium gracile]